MGVFNLHGNLLATTELSQLHWVSTWQEFPSSTKYVQDSLVQGTQENELLFQL